MRCSLPSPGPPPERFLRRWQRQPLLDAGERGRRLLLRLDRLGNQDTQLVPFPLGPLLRLLRPRLGPGLPWPW
jgi:hypothetical protein